MKKNIIITGFMGTGKTAVGKKLAQSLKRHFFDLDTIVEEQEKLKIADIFEERGEVYFRNRECEVLLSLCRMTNSVIATGGGTLLDTSSREMALKHGIIFCLTASLDILCERLRSSDHRPLLVGENLRDKLQELWKARESLYSLLPHQIDTSTLSPEQTVQEILAKYQVLLNENHC